MSMYASSCPGPVYCCVYVMYFFVWEEISCIGKGKSVPCVLVQGVVHLCACGFVDRVGVDWSE